MVDDGDRYRMLLDALRLVAAPFSVQVSVLPGFVHVPDEILEAVQFRLVSQLEQSHKLSREQASAFSALDAYMSSLDWKEEWNEDYELALEACRADPWWTELRSRAMEVLVLLGESWSRPTLDGVTYVRGPTPDAADGDDST